MNDMALEMKEKDLLASFYYEELCAEVKRFLQVWYY